MRDLHSKIVVGNLVIPKKQYIEMVAKWVNKNFIMQNNLVNIPKEPDGEIFEYSHTEKPLIMEFKMEQLKGLHYLIASILSMGIDIGKKQAQIDFNEERKNHLDRIDELESELAKYEPLNVMNIKLD